ncbi:MAG: Gfo/Idh/MocA family protein [Halobacteriaceae archaeon]
MPTNVAFVGTGDPGADGFAMAYEHAAAYEKLDGCELVACADLVPENAEAFADEHGIDEGNVYEDHVEMAEELDLDVVSVCVPPAAHSPVVVDLARAGVGAVHCEKPMAHSWGGARLMAQEADRHGVRLTFNHQRRFAPAWTAANERLEAGDVGEIQRIEVGAPNLYDWGTHCLDLCEMFLDEASPEWVIGQVDYREEQVLFGAHNENQALAQVEYENGVGAVVSAGEGSHAVGAMHRLHCTEGTVEVNVHDGPDARLRRRGEAEWEVLDTPGEEWTGAIDRAIADVVESYRAGEESQLCARNALNATETIFAAWESARRRGRVDLPLEADDNPLEAMVESGDLTPEPSED